MAHILKILIFSVGLIAISLAVPSVSSAKELLQSPCQLREKTIAPVLKEAEKGDYMAMREALVYSGMCLKGHKEEYRWAERLAKLGIAMQEEGYATMLDSVGQHEQAASYYRIAAAKGEPMAAYHLAIGCQEGRFKCDDLNIADLLERAVRAGNGLAVEPLAELLYRSTNTTLHLEKAAGWLLYSNRHDQCHLTQSEKTALSRLRSKMTKGQWKVAVELSHIEGRALFNKKPIDGTPCLEEEGF